MDAQFGILARLMEALVRATREGKQRTVLDLVPVEHLSVVREAAADHGWVVEYGHGENVATMHLKRVECAKG